LNGIEKEVIKEKGVFIARFADDIVVVSPITEKLEKTKEVISKFLKPRGLSSNEEKIVITTIEKGFNYLGVNIREYKYNPMRYTFTDETLKGMRKPGKKGVVITKPAKKSIQNFKVKISEIF